MKPTKLKCLTMPLSSCHSESTSWNAPSRWGFVCQPHLSPCGARMCIEPTQKSKGQDPPSDWPAFAAKEPLQAAPKTHPQTAREGEKRQQMRQGTGSISAAPDFNWSFQAKWQPRQPMKMCCPLRSRPPWFDGNRPVQLSLSSVIPWFL